MQRWIIFFVGVFILFGSWGMPMALAQTPTGNDKKDPCEGEPVSVQCKDDPTKQCLPLCNPLKRDTTDIKVIIGIIIRAALGIVGSLTLLMLVWGGFMWLTSAGSPERVKKGADTMLWAAIGVFFVFASYFILSNFTDYLTGRK